MLNWILDNLGLVIPIFCIGLAIAGWATSASKKRRSAPAPETRYPGAPAPKPLDLDEILYGSSLSGEPEPVEFAAFAPRSVMPNSSFILDIWACRSFDYSSISEIAKARGANNVGRKTGVPIWTGAILAIRVEVSQLIIKDPIDTLVWTGVPANTSYMIEVPADTAMGNYPGKAFISCEGLTLAKLPFLISVATAESNKYVDNSSETIYHKTAFASYASENREEVLSRIQGMKKIAPDLDVFIDAFTLRSGDNWQNKLEQHVPTKDTFYLFWSDSAARSLWVEREWKLALERRGIDYIDPVPLEDIDHAPPPAELNSLHFSDSYVTYIQYHRLKKQEIERQKKIAKDLDESAFNLRRGIRCPVGHTMDPSWDCCPYCESEQRWRTRTRCVVCKLEMETENGMYMIPDRGSICSVCLELIQTVTQKSNKQDAD